MRHMSKTLAFVVDELQKRKGQWPALAQASGVSKRTFEKIAHGKTKNPRIDTVERLAAYLKKRAG